MSGTDGGGDSSIPFGFTFVGHDDRQQQGQDESHPPSGPPLLDNNETGLLRDFFDNPNNIDPGFLALAQSRQQEQDLYASPQHQWFLPQDQSQHTANPSHQTSPVQAFGQQQNPSEDVYAAARLLHSNQGGYTNGSMASPSFSGATHAPSVAMYGYPHSPSGGFSGPGLGEEQVAHPEQSMYQSMLAQGRPGSSRRPAPLNFGSDREFHGTKYAAPNMQKPPEHDLMNILSSFSHDTTASPTHTRYQSLPDRPSIPSSSRRKRRRRSSEEEEDSELSEEEEAPRKSRRARARLEEEEDSDDEESMSTSRKRKRTSAKSKVPPSPRHRRKSSPVGKKPQRENLTEEQKRSNHIHSEQKRRNLIKMGFDDTNRMVPELRAGGFSKSNMLQEAARFMRELKEGNNRMAAMLGMIDKG